MGPKTANKAYLQALDVYGFDKYETVILASLVTGDPLLLIGEAGTGKTFLLNSLSEALGLEHRHYNASLISFDDLVGFPYPDPEKCGVKFLETPATVWGAESVLVDEISRCKPEHQNRLFSLIHERRVQGIALSRLRYRWAAMNPCSADQSAFGDYAGSEPLDQALADRFALFVPAASWPGLSEEDRIRIADPSGEGKPADDQGRLRGVLEKRQADFKEMLPNAPHAVVAYVAAAVTALNNAKVAISPRRSRFLARSLLASMVLAGEIKQPLFRSILACSIPHVAWGVHVKPEVVAAAHRLAWEATMLTGDKAWVHQFHIEMSLPNKMGMLLTRCPSPDAATQAVSELIADEKPERAGAFAFALYPAALKGLGTVGAEGVNDLGKLAMPIMEVDAEISWQERSCDTGSRHPDFVRLAFVVNKLGGARQARAKQFFYWCLAQKIVLNDPAGIEQELNQCVELVAQHLQPGQSGS